MASYGSGDPAATDLPNGGEDSDSQKPEYELKDDNQELGDIVGQQPAYELVDDSPPPPDDRVIAREEARVNRIQRSWLLGTFIGVFVVVILSTIGLGAALPSEQWLQVKPEIDTIRTSMFAVLLVIIGYYFGERRHR